MIKPRLTDCDYMGWGKHALTEEMCPGCRKVNKEETKTQLH